MLLFKNIKKEVWIWIIIGIVVIAVIVFVIIGYNRVQLSPPADTKSGEDDLVAGVPGWAPKTPQGPTENPPIQPNPYAPLPPDLQPCCIAANAILEAVPSGICGDCAELVFLINEGVCQGEDISFCGQAIDDALQRCVEFECGEISAP